MAPQESTQRKPALGYYVTLLVVVLSLASAFMYRQAFFHVTYTHGPLFSPQAFYLLLGGAVIALALLAIKQADFAPVVLCLSTGLAFLFFVHRMIWPFADLVTAIDPVAFVPELFRCTGFIFASFVVAEVALYMRKTKKTAR